MSVSSVRRTRGTGGREMVSVNNFMHTHIYIYNLYLNIDNFNNLIKVGKLVIHLPNINNTHLVKSL